MHRLRRDVNREREALREHNRTEHALTVSRTLDYIFHESRYDPKFRLVVTKNVVLYPKFGAIYRPEFDGNPTIVEVNIYVRSMGQVDEAKSLFTLDIYFR